MLRLALAVNGRADGREVQRGQRHAGHGGRGAIGLRIALGALGRRVGVGGLHRRRRVGVRRRVGGGCGLLRLLLRLRILRLRLLLSRLLLLRLPRRWVRRLVCHI